MRPLPKDRKEIQRASSVIMVGEKDFLKTLKVKNTPCFAIVLKPKFGEKGKELGHARVWSTQDILESSRT